ncbi:MAG: hypothetical protein LWW88_02430, partial [Acinetobacter sp.]|uniref:hypothetical protein n=1 Tax=Acinetobacter sp. TaxID=472 RepID=UPI002590E3DA
DFSLVFTSASSVGCSTFELSINHYSQALYKQYVVFNHKNVFIISKLRLDRFKKLFYKAIKSCKLFLTIEYGYSDLRAL